MIRNLFTLLLVCAFALCNAAELKDYSLVIPDNAPYELRLAAKELAHYAEKITAKKMNVNGTGAKIIVRIDPAQKDLLYDGYKIFTQKNARFYIFSSIRLLNLCIIFFSSLEIYDWDIPNKSATSFCVYSFPSLLSKP